MSVDTVLNDIKEHNIMYLGVATDSSNHKSIKLFPIVIYFLIGKMVDFSLNCSKSKQVKMKNL